MPAGRTDEPGWFARGATFSGVLENTRANVLDLNIFNFSGRNKKKKGEYYNIFLLRFYLKLYVTNMIKA